ncbi:hypothetical protein TH53_08410 [Pedobacter lusitanus]|uniref:Uncharacterized protein n=2 Tax=Pedobacter lusitanus TaxID=1503925 RepID=A0A0D0F7M3_9SPHI|nr:hypothetical protein TH53_08410 [Pedobacter lusitanus]
MFSCLIVSATLANAKPLKFGNPVKERVNEVAVAPVRLSKTMSLVVVRSSSTSPLGVPVSGGWLKNENTGEIAGGSGSRIAINASIGDVISAEVPYYADGRKLKGYVVITEAYYERGSGNLWVR